jgi:hypothetical protein
LDSRWIWNALAPAGALQPVRRSVLIKILRSADHSQLRERMKANPEGEHVAVRSILPDGVAFTNPLVWFVSSKCAAPDSRRVVAKDLPIPGENSHRTGNRQRGPTGCLY